MRFELLDDGIDKIKALTMVVILGLGASACTNFDPGNGSKVRDCKYSSAPSDIAVTTNTNDPNYSPSTDPRELLKFKKLMAKGSGIHDNSSEDIYNSDGLDKLGEVECFTDPDNPNGSLVLNDDGRQLREACIEEGVPSYAEHPAKQIC